MGVALGVLVPMILAIVPALFILPVFASHSGQRYLFAVYLGIGLVWFTEMRWLLRYLHQHRTITTNTMYPILIFWLILGRILFLCLTYSGLIKAWNILIKS